MKVCEVCGSTKKVTKHHMLNGAIMILCRDCHDKQHDIKRKEKGGGEVTACSVVCTVEKSFIMMRRRTD